MQATTMRSLKFMFFVLLLHISVETKKTCPSNDLHALILARGGSKGIKLKNLAEIDGFSLLSRTIKTIKNANCFKYIWVSTDDKQIALEASKYGALVHNRAAKYALDKTSSIEAVQEFLEVHRAIQNFSLFQCTSIFLKEEYIIEAVDKFQSHDCVFAVKRTHQLRWREVDGRMISINFDAKARPRRQDWEGDLVETGMFYFSKRGLTTKGILQNEMCSVVEIAEEDDLEIDSQRDLNIARCMAKEIV